MISSRSFDSNGANFLQFSWIKIELRLACDAPITNHVLCNVDIQNVVVLILNVNLIDVDNCGIV